MKVTTNEKTGASYPAGPAAPSPRYRQLLQLMDEFSLVLIFALLFFVLSIAVPHFLSIENLLGLALSVSQSGMVACTMMFCLASRDFDLSVGSTDAIAGVL
jgi:L-arabinose transport system permease protein